MGSSVPSRTPTGRAVLLGLAVPLSAASACADDAPIALALPSLGNAETAVAALIADGELREVRVLERGATTLTFDAAPDVVARGTVALAGYQGTMSSLDVRVGRLEPALEGHPLPAPDVLLTRALDVASAPWSPAASLPAPLAAARFDAFGPRCPTFQPSPIAFPEAGVRFAIEIAGDQVLAALDSGALVALRPGEAPRSVSTSTSIADGIASAVARPDGSVALIDAFCCVYPATLAADQLTIGPRECPARDECGIVVAAVAHADAASLTWITLDGKVTTHTPGSGFRRLAHLEETEGPGRVTRDGDGTTFAAQATRNLGVISAAGAPLRLEAVPTTGTHLTALAHVPGVGLLLGDSAGHVFRRDGPGDYAALGDPGLFGGVTLFHALPPDGLWVIGGNGGGAVWRDGAFCPLEQVGAGIVFFAPRLGEGWLLIGTRSSGSPVAVATWLRPVP